MLFGLWKRVCSAAGWEKAEADLQRSEFTALALDLNIPGDDIPSWGALSKAQISTLKDALNIALGHLSVESSDAGAESPADAFHRRQLVWGCERDFVAAYGDLAGAEQAIASICADVLGTSHQRPAGFWRGLPLRDLERLRGRAAVCKRSRFSNIDRSGAVPGGFSPKSALSA